MMVEEGKHKLGAYYVRQPIRCFLRLSHNFMRRAIYSCFKVSKARLRELYVSSSSLNFFWYQFSSVTQSSPTLCDPRTAACKASLSITNSWSLLKLMSIESVMLSNHLILYRPLLLLLSILPSIRVFSKESDLCVRWTKYQRFSISPSNGS